MKRNESGKSRILIDGFSLGLEDGTGVSTYARNLSYALHDLNHEVHVLYGHKIKGGNPLLREISFFDVHRRETETVSWIGRLTEASANLATFFGVSAHPIDLTGAVIDAPFRSRLPYFDRLWNARDVFRRADRHFYRVRRRFRVTIPLVPDIAHWTFPIPIWMPVAKNIYTIHDLVPLRLPYATLDIKRRHYRKLKLLCQQADHIVTVSETSRKDIINLLGIPEDRVSNTYQSVSLPARHTAKTEDIVRREVEGTFNLTHKNYLLFYGAIEPKKNVGRMIEAYLAAQIDTPLVIVGKSAWLSEQELRIINDDVVRYLETIDRLTVNRSRVHRIPYVPFPLLISLIRGAKALLFPSLYEGFGLPAVEAMMLGTPVLTSTGGSMPEIAGDAAIKVDPFDTAEMTQAIRALDANAELRGELATKGKARAQLFSPENYRRRLAELYARLR